MRARISVNEIRSLEYHTWGPEPETVGSASDILRDLVSWSRRLEFGDRGLEHLHHGKSYLHGIEAFEHGVVLCLWHEGGTVDGKVLFADEHDGAVSARKVDKGKIAGVPAYYWIPSPPMDSVCHVGLPFRPASREKLANFLKAFMTTSCSLVNRTQYADEESAEVFSCHLPDDGRPVRPLVHFATAMRGDVGDLRAQLAEVRGIERKETKVHAVKELHSLFKRLFGLEEDGLPRTSRVHYKVDTPNGITKALFDDIVDYYQERGDEQLDIGFYKAKQGVQWLSGRRLVAHHELGVREEDGVVVSLADLAQELAERRNKILGGKAS